MLEAICARIIPSDANGPGAREARAAHLHRSRARRRAQGIARGVSRRASRRSIATADRRARAPFTELSDARSGLGADRRRDRRRHRLPGSSGAVLRHGAHAHAAGHVRRSVLRRQRELRRLGSDRLPGPSPQRHGRGSAARREADADASIGLRPRHVHQGAGIKASEPSEPSCGPGEVGERHGH